MKPESHFNKVLITGINGFTGVYLEQYLLKQGYNVFGTVIDTPEKNNHLQCDITQKDQVDYVISTIRPDFVIHIAAISFVGEMNASLIYDVNVIGTENILNSLLDNAINPQKVIISSSAAVYGNQDQEILDESMCPKPVNHYGVSKLSMEYITANYFDKLEIIITRPFNYTGVGQEPHFLIPKIISHFKERKKEIELGNLDVAREFNDIHYVIEIYFRLLVCKAHSTVVNISSNKSIKLLEVIETLNKLAGYKIRVKINPDFIRANEVKSLSGSQEKLFKLIGNVEQKGFEKTLGEMFEA